MVHHGAEGLRTAKTHSGRSFPAPPRCGRLWANRSAAAPGVRSGKHSTPGVQCQLFHFHRRQPASPAASLDDLPRRTAHRFPDRTPVVDGGTRLTFGEFEQAVAAAASALSTHGASPGDRLALPAAACHRCIAA
ncbi:AMP-binding protein [Arthrobacter sp. zg-Y820]|uniref:AMP-binding protein n=1 Tax=Arthrobacter sp. zg-Y820 TaxID=2894192 RepID=UPI003FA4D23F